MATKLQMRCSSVFILRMVRSCLLWKHQQFTLHDIFLFESTCCHRLKANVSGDITILSMQQRGLQRETQALGYASLRGEKWVKQALPREHQWPAINTRPVKPNGDDTEIKGRCGWKPTPATSLVWPSAEYFLPAAAAYVSAAPDLKLGLVHPLHTSQPQEKPGKQELTFSTKVTARRLCPHGSKRWFTDTYSLSLFQDASRT